jgi:hypothetical protein
MGSTGQKNFLPGDKFLALMVTLTYRPLSCDAKMPMEKSSFDQLLHRYLLGEASPAERQRLDAWLDMDKTGLADKIIITEEQIEAGLERILSMPFDPPEPKPTDQPPKA